MTAAMTAVTTAAIDMMTAGIEIAMHLQGAGPGPLLAAMIAIDANETDMTTVRAATSSETEITTIGDGTTAMETVIAADALLL